MRDPFVRGDGFNTLAEYLFGGNSEERAMAMTTPVAIDYAGDKPTTMSVGSLQCLGPPRPPDPLSPRPLHRSFVLPREVGAEGAPAPNNNKVFVSERARATVAAREFPGFATEGEVISASGGQCHQAGGKSGALPPHS